MARLELTLEVDIESFQRAVDRRLVADVQIALMTGLLPGMPESRDRRCR